MCGLPDDTNTGITPGAVLTRVPSQATSGPGWKYSNDDVTITGNVGSATTGLELADGVTALVKGSNVTVTNLKLDGAHGHSTDGIFVCGNATGVAGCYGVANNVTITHCDLTGAPEDAGPVSPDRGWNGIHIQDGAASTTVSYCDIHGFSGGFFLETELGADVFTHNYVHDIVMIDNNGTDHCNDWELGGGPSDTTSSIVLADNTFWMDAPSCGSDAIAFFNDGAPTSNLHALVYRNLVSGATNCVNYGYGDAHSGPSVPSYIAIIGMHYSTRYGANCGSNAYSYPPWPINTTYGPGGCPTGQANCGGDPNSFQCQNVWDGGPYSGAGADGGANGEDLTAGDTYPNAMFTVKPCPSPLASWVPPLPPGT